MSEESMKRNMSEEDQEKDIKKDVPCCSMHPKSYLFQGIGLLCICSIGFGFEFCYDGPGALEEEFKSAMDMNSKDFSLLYALYSFPNMVIPIVGGFLIDKVFGIRLGTVIFAACIATGQALTTLGCFIDSKAVVYLGRFVFGLGAENLEVACATFTSSWFSGTALNMAFGFQLASFKVGSAVSLMVLGPIYDAFFPEECVFEGTTSVDPDALTLPTTAFITTQAIMNSTSNPRDCKKEENLALGWTMTVACSCVVLCLVGAVIAGLLDKIRSKYILTKLEEQPKIQLKDLKTFPQSYWLVSIICVAYYVAISPFISFAQPFFKREDGFNFDDTEASTLQSLPYYMLACLAPLLGFVIDRKGRNIAWIMFSCVTTLIAHCLLISQSTQTLAYVAIVIMGIGYSTLASSLWPMIAMIVPLNRRGTAYGVIQAIQNAGLSGISYAVGAINDIDDTYVYIEIFYIAWLAVAILATVFMWILDFRENNYLFMSDKQRKEFEKTPEYFKSMNMEMHGHLRGEGKENVGFEK